MAVNFIVFTIDLAVYTVQVWTDEGKQNIQTLAAGLKPNEPYNRAEAIGVHGVRVLLTDVEPKGTPEINIREVRIVACIKPKGKNFVYAYV